MELRKAPIGCKENIAPTSILLNPCEYANVGKNGAITDIELQTAQLEKFRQFRIYRFSINYLNFF